MDKPAISADIVLSEINKMVKAHEERKHTLLSIGIDTLGLIFRCPVAEMIVILNELDKRGLIVVNLHRTSDGKKKKSGSVMLPLKV